MLGVEGEDALVVSSDQQQRGESSGQRFQPAHVEGAGHRALPRQRHAPAHRDLWLNRRLTAENHTIFNYEETLVIMNLLFVRALDVINVKHEYQLWFTSTRASLSFF